MNYYSSNPEVRQAVLKLLGDGFSEITKVNFGASFAQNKRLSVITIEVSPTPIVHSLVFFYARGLVLYDVIYYRNKSFYRMTRKGEALKLIDRINQLLMKWITRCSQVAMKKIAEDLKSSEEKERKEQEIQRLKDRIEVEKSINKGLRNQMKALRAKSSMRE